MGLLFDKYVVTALCEHSGLRSLQGSSSNNSTKEMRVDQTVSQEEKEQGGSVEYCDGTVSP